MAESTISRRDLLKGAVVVGAGLSIAVYLDACARLDADPPATNAPFAPDAWIRVETDGTVTVMVDRTEMGQGVTTALPMLVADELDADWSKVRFEPAPVHRLYQNPLAGSQRTGGSTSVRAAWLPLREAAAKARAMLVLAAAQVWGVHPESCRTRSGIVVHPPSGRSASYGELAVRAGKLRVPATVVLKEPKDFTLIGTAVPRLDVPSKVDGTAVFGIDVQLPGLLVATVARCPVPGGTVKRFDPAKALAVAGVRHVVQIDSGVAVVAEGYWQALRGRTALSIEWDEGPLATADTELNRGHLGELAAREGATAKRRGDVSKALSRAVTRIDAVYDLPYLAHATMEPTNCTAHVTHDHCTVWVPTQYQSGSRFGDGAREAAARAARLPVSAVTVHTTMAGGAFGRGVEDERVLEAVQLSRVIGDAVKVIWSREDDLQHDHYRPATHHRLEGGLDSLGRPSGWHHRIVGPSIMSRFAPTHLPDWIAHRIGPLKHGVDGAAVEGAVTPPYRLPEFQVDYVMAQLGVPVGFWRSVGQSHNVFVVESFIDELAHAAGRDPAQFRRDLLSERPRLRAVLDLAIAKAGWNSAGLPGRGRGIAVAEIYGSFIAQVAEVGVEGSTVRVHRVVCAVDCGIVVNPNIVTAQIEGGIAFGLSAALKEEVTVERGRVKQSNFHDYPLLRLPEMPFVEVFIVQSREPPGGVGEAATPLIAPAVTNALFQTTGERVRRLPIRLDSAVALRR